MRTYQITLIKRQGSYQRPSRIHIVAILTNKTKKSRLLPMRLRFIEILLRIYSPKNMTIEVNGKAIEVNGKAIELNRQQSKGNRTQSNFPKFFHFQLI